MRNRKDPVDALAKAKAAIAEAQSEAEEISALARKMDAQANENGIFEKILATWPTH